MRISYITTNKPARLMREILNRLYDHGTFSSEETRQILIDLASGIYNNSQMAAFLSAFCMRSITVAELRGFRDAMLELCIPVDLDAYGAIDLCGTGGDGKHTFNISTLASFILAGAGHKVAKHGNYGVSSLSGSSNVMEYFGYKFSTDKDQMVRSMDEAGLCFLHAPLFHPAMKTLAPIRRELGVKTFFNMLGPMVNPSSPKFQLVGVFSLELARLYNYLYQDSLVNFYIVHSLDGYDEISLTADIKIFSNKGEQLVARESLTAEVLTADSISGGKSAEESAGIFAKILLGEGTEAQNKVVCWNAAFGINCLTPERDLQSCYAEASESLFSGKANKSFKKLLEINRN